MIPGLKDYAGRIAAIRLQLARISAWAAVRKDSDTKEAVRTITRELGHITNGRRDAGVLPIDNIVHLFDGGPDDAA